MSRLTSRLLATAALSVTAYALFPVHIKAQTEKGAHATGPTVGSSPVARLGGSRGTSAASTSTNTVMVGTREISATSDGDVSMQADEATANVRLGSHVVTVEKQRLLIDGKEKARLPASTSKVGIAAHDGRVTVKADGRSVLSDRLDTRKR